MFIYLWLINYFILHQDELSSNSNSHTTSHLPESEKNYGWQNDSNNKQSFRNWSLFGGTIILSGTLYGVSIEIITRTRFYLK